jgi:hypothetical protein
MTRTDKTMIFSRKLQLIETKSIERIWKSTTLKENLHTNLTMATKSERILIIYPMKWQS